VPGLLRGVVRTAAVVGTASAVSGRVQHRQAQRWAQQDMEEAPAAQEPPTSPIEAQPAARASGDRLEQLAQLGELKAQGVLTEDEFAQEKARILGG